MDWILSVWIRLTSRRFRSYRGATSEEVSKRIHDLHKRFDDLRGDVNRRFDDVDRRLGELRADMNGRFNELREDMNHRFNDVGRTLRTFVWIVSGWFTFLTAVLAVFGFLPL